ncbi:DegV family protein [Clostridium chrysemydis]|uniref:DegV family protein n=1 Tax=Clostridium chrysemydis TaxID=2665504 RepID=UPI001883EAE5|nr:DegV family protein [Clostridium chrysemydis]
MKKIAIMTDSSCDLDLKTIEEYNIEMLPLRIVYKDKEFLDKITLSSSEMFESLKVEVPTTSLPDLHNTEKVIERLKSEGYTDVIVATVSSKLSGTYNSVRLVCESHPELDYHFFDTRTLGYPQGVIVLEIAKLINSGKDLEYILNSMEDIRKRTHGYITFDTLEFLTKGGRIGKVAGTIGEILHLKPIVSSDDDGELYNYKKARGRKKAISKMKDILTSYLDKGKCRVWVLDGHCRSEVESFYESVKDYNNITEISIESIGPAMGIHTGPGALGLCIYEESE